MPQAGGGIDLQRDALLARLDWFYTLEINQVNLYLAQASKAPDIYLAKTLERVAVIEQRHVDNISTAIRELGGSPTWLGDVISPLLGNMAGSLSGTLGPPALLSIDIKLEEKAMHDYKKLILLVGDHQSLFDTLWANLIDEDLHTAWFANKLAHWERVAGSQTRG